MSWKVQFRETRRNNHHQSHILDSLNRKQTVAKETVLIEAVEWCTLNGHRDWKTVNSGLFSGIKDPRTINKRLDGVIETGKEKDYCKILTSTEEESLSRYIKNRNRQFWILKIFFDSFDFQSLIFKQLFQHYIFVNCIFLPNRQKFIINIKVKDQFII